MLFFYIILPQRNYTPIELLHWKYTFKELQENHYYYVDIMPVRHSFTVIILAVPCLFSCDFMKVFSLLAVIVLELNNP